MELTFIEGFADRIRSRGRWGERASLEGVALVLEGKIALHVNRGPR